MQSYLSFLSMHNTSTLLPFLFIPSTTIIVNLSNNVVACHATIPLPPCHPPLLLKFYNFASPFVRTLRNAARQSLCGFQKFCIFACKKSPDAPGDSLFWKLSMTKLSFLKSAMKKWQKWQFIINSFVFIRFHGNIVALTLHPVSLVTGRFSGVQS